MKRFIVVLFSVVIAVAILLVIKNECTRFLPSPGFGMNEIVQAGEVEQLFMGSSTFKRGLDIEVLEQNLPGKTYILAYNGNQPVMMVQELEYLVKSGLRIKKLYIDYYPYTIAAEPKVSDTRLFLDTDLNFKRSIWRELSSAETSLTGRISLFFELFVTANNDQILWWPVYRVLNRSKNRHGGSLQKLPGSTPEKLDSLPMLGTRDGVQKRQIDAIARMISFAKANQIDIHFIETPKYERLLNDDDYKKIYKDAEDILSVHKIKPMTVQFDHAEASYFKDLVHLSGKGAEIYTRLLCEQM